MGTFSVRKTTEQFLKEAINKHGDKYNYSKVDYITAHTKVCIICPKHGEFWQTSNKHVTVGRGCPKCAWEKTSLRSRLTTEQFIKKAKAIHGDKYDYSKTDYVNSHTKVCIICPEHGEFWQIPTDHLSGCGCPKCHIVSYGEIYIENFLKEFNIKFEVQKKFKECKNVFSLPFDFYLPDYNLCIEYQGEQHFKPARFGTKEEESNRLRKRQERDKIKKEWCLKEENPNLLEIKYDENIREKLLKELKLNE